MKNVKAFNITVQGANHIKHKKVCQDYSYSYDLDSKLAFAIVCDGHGGDDYIRSDVGAKEATEIAGSCIEGFIASVLKKYDIDYLQRHYEEVLRGLASSIITQWRNRIEDHYNANPFTEEELNKLSEKAQRKYATGNIASAYGTTMIAVAFTDEYWFGLKVGDGKCVSISNRGEFCTPIPDDGICFLNATTSLCDKNAIENFRYVFSLERPAAVFIGTDGIDDCFNRDEQLFNLYKTTLYSFVTSDFSQAKNDLRDYLPRLSSKGSGDDVSIGAIIDYDVAGELEIVKNFNTKPSDIATPKMVEDGSHDEVLQVGKDVGLKLDVKQILDSRKEDVATSIDSKGSIEYSKNAEHATITLNTYAGQIALPKQENLESNDDHDFVPLGFKEISPNEYVPIFREKTIKACGDIGSQAGFKDEVICGEATLEANNSSKG